VTVLTAISVRRSSGKSAHRLTITPSGAHQLETQDVAKSSPKLSYITSLATTFAMTTISRQDLFDKVWSVDHSLDPETEQRTRYLEPKVRPGAPWWYWRR
jgi:hypothetical protein